MLSEAVFGDILETVNTGPRNQYYMNELMIEAAGIEPAQSINPNPLMARDFYSKRFQGLPFAIPPLSPAVLPSPLLSSPVVEVFWRRAGKFPAPDPTCPEVVSSVLETFWRR